MLADWETSTLAPAGLDLRKVVYKLAARQYTASPFGEEWTVALRTKLIQLLKSEGFKTEPVHGDAPQRIDLRLLQAVLHAAGDPDRLPRSPPGRGY